MKNQNLLKIKLLTLLFLNFIFFNACNAEHNSNQKKDTETINKKNLVEVDLDLKNTNVSNSTASFKTDLEKAKNECKAVFVVVTGAGSVDTDKAVNIAKEASIIYKNSTVLQMNRDDSENADLVKEWRLSGAPLPLILVVSTKGLLTGGYVLKDATAANVAALVPSPKLESVYDAISKGKHAIVVFSKSSFTDKKEVIKIAKEAVAQLKNEAVFIEVDMEDTKETSFMNQLKVSPLMTKSSVTIVFNKQGQVAGTSTTVPDVAKLVSAAKTPVKSGCGPGCGPAGCGK